MQAVSISCSASYVYENNEPTLPPHTHTHTDTLITILRSPSEAE